MRQDLMRYCGLMTALLLFLNINNIQAQNFCGYIDPTIGSEGHGNVFIGPSCPFGMVKPGPDNNKDMNSGFDPDTAKAIYGFSQVHVSGTGGGPKYGNISIMPFAKQFKQIEQTSLWTEDQAKAGYYAVTLRNGNIRVEITTSPKVAFYRYQFRDQGPKGLKIDLGKFLGEEATPDAREAQQFVGSEVELVSESEIRGYSRIRGGWNNGTAYTVYFYAIVDKTASSYGTWKADNLYPGVGSQSDSGEKTGIWLQFDKKPTTIQVKIGISFVSTLKAKENIQTEMPHWNFNQVLAETRARWDSLIDRIDIGKSAPKEQLIQFYT
ncbi:MAG: glycoside hydrolase family 92 protein, partial [Bacteroidota bacterium]|nr:glycoside hydrolase family 92 protein [Bacteroidota bacterium]